MKGFIEITRQIDGREMLININDISAIVGGGITYIDGSETVTAHDYDELKAKISEATR